MVTIDANSNAGGRTEATSFAWITNRTTQPYVTIDSQQRLYISSPAKELMGLPHGKVKFRLIAGYDFANHRIVLAKPEIVRVPNIEPFSFDKRSYSKVKNFVSRARIGDMLPVRFVYVGKDYSEYPSGSFAFQLEGYQAEDV
jgi:hypothetical protein